MSDRLVRAKATAYAEITEGSDALRACLERTRDRLTRWRYATRDCPACGRGIHTADCWLVATLEDIAAATERAA